MLSNDDIGYFEEMYVSHPIVNAINKNLPHSVVLLNKK